MEIKLSSRKKRIQLYNIPESVVIDILENMEFSASGKQEIVKDVLGFELPIKIVFDVQEEIITIITLYPLKKRRKK